MLASPLADWTLMSPRFTSFDSFAALLGEGERRRDKVQFWLSVRPDVREPDRPQWAQEISPHLVSTLRLLDMISLT